MASDNTSVVPVVKTRHLVPQVSFFVFVRIILHTSFAMLMPLLPVFSRGLGIDITLAGRALSISLLSNLLVPFLTSLAERYGQRFGMILGLVIFTLGGAVMLVWQTYTAFVIATFLMTLGTFVFLPVMQSYIGENVPYNKRGLMVAFSEFGWAASFIFGVPLIGLLISHYGWLAPYPAFVLIMLLLIVVIMLSFPGTRGKHTGESPFAGIKYVLNSRTGWLGILLGFFIMPGVNMIGVVYGYWLEEVFKLNVSELSASSIIMGIAFGCGSLMVALFTDKLGKRRAIMGGLVLNSLIASAVVFITGELVPALIWIFIFYVTMEFSVVSGLTLLTEILPEYRTSLLALSTAAMGFGGAFGSFMAPYLYRFGFSANIFGCIIINIIIIGIILALKPKNSRRWLDD